MKKSPFAERIERAMREKGVGLRALCREAILDPSFFSKVLAGKRSPPADEAVLRRMAALLDLDAQELIVLTGRIPAEWLPLFSDPETFAALRRLAESPPRQVRRPSAARNDAPSPPSQSRALEAELL